MKQVYPDYKWLFWRFNEHVHDCCWKNEENHRLFFDWLFIQLGYKEMDDWYNVTQEDIHKYGGSRLLNGYYSDSPSKALQSVYPEHEWMMWKFGQTSKSFW